MIISGGYLLVRRFARRELLDDVCRSHVSVSFLEFFKFL